MAFLIDPVCKMDWQGIGLNCGFFCLEAVMEWHHGTKFGAQVLSRPKPQGLDNLWTVVYGDPRTRHTDGVEDHMKKRISIGFSPCAHADRYGLFPLTTPGGWSKLKTSKYDAEAWWEEQLRNYGPILTAGDLSIGCGILGTLGSIAPKKWELGHWVVVVGVGEDSSIIYQDPLDSRNTKGTALSSMSVHKFSKAVFAGKLSVDLLAAYKHANIQKPRKRNNLLVNIN